MNYTEEAIKRAIKEGWKPKHQAQFIELLLEHYSLDPLFWQSLGKAEGWPKVSAYPRESDNEHETCKVVWHSFIDHLDEGKTAEEFFKSLLTQSKNKNE